MKTELDQRQLPTSRRALLVTLVAAGARLITVYCLEGSSRLAKTGAYLAIQPSEKGAALEIEAYLAKLAQALEANEAFLRFHHYYPPFSEIYSQPDFTDPEQIFGREQFLPPLVTLNFLRAAEARLESLLAVQQTQFGSVVNLKSLQAEAEEAYQILATEKLSAVCLPKGLAQLPSLESLVDFWQGKPACLPLNQAIVSPTLETIAPDQQGYRVGGVDGCGYISFTSRLQKLVQGQEHGGKLVVYRALGHEFGHWFDVYHNPFVLMPYLKIEELAILLDLRFEALKSGYRQFLASNLELRSFWEQDLLSAQEPIALDTASFRFSLLKPMIETFRQNRYGNPLLQGQNLVENSRFQALTAQEKKLSQAVRGTVVKEVQGSIDSFLLLGALANGYRKPIPDSLFQAASFVPLAYGKEHLAEVIGAYFCLTSENGVLKPANHEELVRAMETWPEIAYFKAITDVLGKEQVDLLIQRSLSDLNSSFPDLML